VLAAINDNEGRLKVRCAGVSQVGHALGMSRSATRRIAANGPQLSQR
jgi:hypothetical protein